MANKYLVSIVTAVVLLACGGGYWFYRHSHSAARYDGAGSVATDATSSSTGSLGLNVASGSATDLGQLGGSGQSSQSGLVGGQSSTGSASSSPIDPSTFPQYDKYKNNPSALFGDIQVGSGATLDVNKQAAILYKGWLTDGTLFDQSRPNGSGQLQPFWFTLGQHQVIPGLEEGVAGMKVGGSRLIIIPPALGYGDKGQATIPPSSTLVFEVELLDVK